MTAVIAGNGLGVFGSSATQTNGYGGNGNPKVGQGTDGAYVNAVTGNLIVQDSDEFVAAIGLNDALSRTYNSLGLSQGPNSDQWQFSYNRFLSMPTVPVVAGLPSLPLSLGTQPLNGASDGTLVRTVGDGNQETFIYDSTAGSGGEWRSKNGSGAYDTITLATNGGFQYRQGGTLVVENYDSTGKLLTVVDRNGNTQTYNYQVPATSTPGGTTVPVGTVTGTVGVALPATQLASISDSSGQTTYFDYTVNNLTDIRVVGLVPGATSNTQTQTTTRVRYGYDVLNRLTSVTVDLTPADGSILDGKVYTTSYQYDGVSDRVTQIAQSDGSSLTIAYQLVGTNYEVQTLTDGVGNKTSFAYDTVNRVTTVTDPLGAITKYGYSAGGLLTQVTLPTINGSTPTVQYGYDSSGNIVNIVDAAGRVSNFTYDNDGNLKQSVDANGNQVTRTYDSADQLLSATAYTSGSSNPSGGLTTHYVYDSSENLRFVISAQGDVSEYRYSTDGKGERVTSIAYPATAYAGSRFGLSDMATWASQQDQTKLQRADSAFDATGQIKSLTTWASTDSSGKGVSDGTQSTQLFVYDRLGRLLTSVDPRNSSTTAGQPYVTSYAYDGLGRQISLEDATARITTTAYDDVHNTITTARADGVTSTAVYDAAGEKKSVALSKGTQVLGTTTYAYDADGHLIQQSDPTGESTYYFYDSRGRQIGILSPEGELSEVTYNDDNQEISRTSYATRTSATSTTPPPTTTSAVMQAAANALAQATATQQQIQLVIAALPTTISAAAAQAEQTLLGQSGGLITQAGAVVNTAAALVSALQQAAQGVINGPTVANLIATLQTQVAQLQQTAGGVASGLQALIAALPATLTATAQQAIAKASAAASAGVAFATQLSAQVQYLATTQLNTLLQTAAGAQATATQLAQAVVSLVSNLPTTVSTAVAQAEQTALTEAGQLGTQAAQVVAQASVVTALIQQAAQGALMGTVLPALNNAVLLLLSETTQLVMTAQATIQTMQTVVTNLPATVAQQIVQVQSLFNTLVATAVALFPEGLAFAIQKLVATAQGVLKGVSPTGGIDPSVLLATLMATANGLQQTAIGLVGPLFPESLQLLLNQLAKAVPPVTVNLPDISGTVAFASAAVVGAQQSVNAAINQVQQAISQLADSTTVTVLQTSAAAQAAAAQAQAQITAFVNSLPTALGTAAAAAVQMATADASQLVAQAAVVQATALQLALQAQQTAQTTAQAVLNNPILVAAIATLQSQAFQLTAMAQQTVAAVQAVVTNLPTTATQTVAQAQAAAVAAASAAVTQAQAIAAVVGAIAGGTASTVLQTAATVQAAAQAAQAKITALVNALPATVGTAAATAEATAFAEAAALSAQAATVVNTATVLAAQIQQAAQGVLADPTLVSTLATLQAQVALLEQTASTTAQTLQALAAALPATVSNTVTQAAAAAMATVTFVSAQAQGFMATINGLANSATTMALQAAAAAQSAAAAAQAQVTAFVNALPTTLSDAAAAAAAAAVAEATLLSSQAGTLVATATQIAGQAQQFVGGVFANTTLAGLISTLQSQADQLTATVQQTIATLQALATNLPGTLTQAAAQAQAAALAAAAYAQMQVQKVSGAITAIVNSTSTTVLQIAASAQSQAQQLQQQIMAVVTGLPTTLGNTIAFAEQTAFGAAAMLAAQAGAVATTALQVAALAQQTVAGVLANPALVGLENLLQAQVNQLVVVAQSTVAALQALVTNLPDTAKQAVQQAIAMASATALGVVAQATSLAAEVGYLAGTQVNTVLQTVNAAQAAAAQLAQQVVVAITGLPATISSAITLAAQTALAEVSQLSGVAAQVAAQATAVAGMIQQTAEGVINTQLLPVIYDGLATLQAETNQLVTLAGTTATTVQVFIANLPATASQVLATAVSTALATANAVQVAVGVLVFTVTQAVDGSGLEAKLHALGATLQDLINSLPATLIGTATDLENQVFGVVSTIESEEIQLYRGTLNARNDLSNAGLGAVVNLINSVQNLIVLVPATAAGAVSDPNGTLAALENEVAGIAAAVAANVLAIVNTVPQLVDAAQGAATQLAQQVADLVSALPGTVSTTVAQAEQTALSEVSQLSALAAQLMAQANAVVTMITSMITITISPAVNSALMMLENQAGQLVALIQSTAATVQTIVNNLPSTLSSTLAAAEATVIADANYALVQAKAVVATVAALTSGPVNTVLTEVASAQAQVQRLSQAIQALAASLPGQVIQDVANAEATALAYVSYAASTLTSVQNLILATVAGARATALAEVQATLITASSAVATAEASVNTLVTNLTNHYPILKPGGLLAEAAALEATALSLAGSAKSIVYKDGASYIKVLEGLPVAGPLIRTLLSPMPQSSGGINTTQIQAGNSAPASSPRSAPSASQVAVTNASSATNNVTVSSTAAGTITPTTSSLDRTVRSYYDAAGRLGYTVDEDGYATGYSYDGAGRKVSQTTYAIALSPIPTSGNASDVHVSASSADRTIRSFYDNDSRLRATLDAAGYLTETVYDAAGEVSKTIGYATVTNPSLASTGTLDQLRPASDSVNDQTRFAFYNGKGQVTRQIDAGGYLTAFTYDVAGNQLQQTRYATAVSYSGSGPAPTASTSSSDQIALAQYDALDRVIQQTDAQGTVTTFNYDSVTGFLTSKSSAANQTNGLGVGDTRTVSYQYDSLGRVTDTISGKGNAAIANGANPNTVATTYGTQQTYDLAGRLASVIDADGHTRYYYYDGDSRLRYTVDAAGEVSESQYDAFGDVTKSIQYHQPISTSGLKGGLISADSNFSSQINGTAEQSDSLNRFSTSTYGDNRGLLTQTVDAKGFGTAYGYDSFGALAVSRRDAGATPGAATDVEQIAYDVRGFKSTSTRDVGVSNYLDQLRYDAFGRLVQTTDANGNVASTQYDRLGRTVTVTDALGQSTLASYDAFSRVLTQTDRTGNVTAYTYNDATQSVTVTTPEGIISTTQSNRHGQKISFTDGTGAISTYAYDADGNLLNSVTDAGGSGHLNLTRSSTYDTADLLKTSTDTTGVVTTYGYDAANRVLTRTVDPSGLNLQTSYAYDAFGGAIRVIDPAGVVTETVFDNRGQSAHVITDTAGLKLATSYTYDAAGKTLTVSEGQQASGSAGTGVNSGSWTYGAAVKTTQYIYDDLERLSSQIVDPGNGTNSATGKAYLNLTTKFAYDGNDNLISKTDPNGNISRYIYDADNRAAFTVDGAGDVTQTVYDAEGRVTQSIAYGTPIVPAVPATIPGISTVLGLTNNNSLAPGQKLTAGQAIYSKGGAYELVYQGDGNLVLYSWSSPLGTVVPLWASNTPGTSPGYAIFQTDGSLAIYNQSGTQIFNSGSGGKSGATLNLQPDGNLVIYSSSAAIWATNTANPAAPSPYRISRSVYDGDGRLTYSIDAMGDVTGYSYDKANRVIDTVHYATALTSSQLASLSAAPTPLEVMSAMNGGIYTDGFSNLSNFSDYPSSVNGTGIQSVNNRLVLTSQSTAPYTCKLGNKVYDLSQARVFTLDVTPTASTGYYYLGINSTQLDQGVFEAILHNGQLSVRTINGSAQTGASLGSYSANTTYTIEIVASATSATLYFHIKGQSRNSGITYTTALTPSNWPNVRARIETATGNNEVAYVDNLSVLSALPDSNPADEHTRMAYDAAGRAVFQLDALGNLTQNRYDADGRVTAVTRYAQPITAPIVTNSTTIQQNLVTSNKDETSQTVYDTAGQAVYQVDALNHLVQNIFDADGHLIQARTYNAPLPAGTTLTKAGIDTQLASSQSIKDDNQDRVVRYVYDTAGRLRFDLRTYSHSNANGASLDTVYVSETRYNTIGWVSDSYTYATPITIDSTTSPTAASVAAAIVTNAADEHSANSYDAAGRLRVATDARGSTEQYSYDAAGNKTSYTNKNGFTWNYIYDAANRLTLEVNPTSAVYSTSASGPVSVGLYYEQTATGISYDAFGEVASRSDGIATNNNGAYSFTASRTTSYRYDALGRQIATVAPNFNVYNATNDTNTNYGATRSTFEDLLSAPTSALYLDAQGNQIAGRDPAGNYSYKLYDKLGRVAYEIDAERDVTAYSYDAFGNVTAVTREPAPISDADATTGSTSTLIQLEKVISAAVPGTAAARDAAIAASAKVAALVTVLVNASTASARTITTTYDLLNRKTQVQLPVADTYTTTSLALGGTTATGAPTTTYTYDAFGDTTAQSQLLDTGSGVKATTFSKYDRLGRLTDQIDPLGYYTRNTYDAFDRLTDTIQYATALNIVPNGMPAFTPPAASLASTSVYSANSSQSTGFTKNVGYDREVGYGYDQLNRKTTQTRVGVLVSNLDSSENLVTSTGNLTTTTGYDNVGNVTSVTNEQNDVTRSYYDPLGHLVGLQQPARYTNTAQTVAPLTGFEYDLFGNQINVERFAESVVMPNDPYGTIPLPQSANDEQSFTRYDLAGHAIETVDALGNIADTSYDALGHVMRTWNAQTDSAGDAAQTKVEIYAYDRAGRQIGTLDVVRDPTQGAAYADLVLTTVQYNAFGESILKATADRLLGSTTANQAGSAYSDYDADGRVWQTNKDGVDTVYRYDLNGDVTAKIVLPGTVQGANTSPIAARLSKPSDINSILSNGVPGTNFIETDYVYDALGRVTQERDPGFTQAVVNATDTGVISLGQVDTITNPNSPQTWSSSATKKSNYVAADDAYEYTYGFSNSVTLKWPTSIASYGSSAIQVTVNYTLSDGTNGSYSISTTASAAVTGATLTWSSKGQDSPQPTITSITSAYVKLQGSGGSSQAIRSTDVSGPGVELFTPSFITPGSFNYQTGSGAFSSVTPTKTASGMNYTVPIPAGSLVPSKVYNYYFTTQESQSNFPSETGITYGGTFTTDANGNIVSFGPSSQLSTTTSPVRKQTLDRWGNVIASVDARNGNWVTKNFYDDHNNLIETIAPGVTAWNSNNTQSETDTPTTKAYYNAAGAKVASDDANGQRTRDVVDASGNVLEERRPDGGDLVNFYDVLGRKVLSSDGDQHVTTYTYDKKDQLLTQDLTEFGSGQDQITTYTYDQSGNRISSSDALGDVTRSVYDTLGQLVASLSPLSSYGGTNAAYVTRYRYDALGRKIGVANNLGAHSTESWSYDYFGRLTGHTDLAGSAYFYTYDGFGRLANQTSTLPGSSYDGSSLADWQQQIFGGQAGYDNGSWSVTNSYGNAAPAFYGYSVRSNADLLTHNFNLNGSTAFAVSFDTAITLNQTNSQAQYFFLSKGNVGPSIFVDFTGTISYNDGAGNTQSFGGFPNNTAVHFAITATENANGTYAVAISITNKASGAAIVSFNATATASGGQVGFASLNSTGQRDAHAMYVDNILVNGGPNSVYQNLAYTYNANGSVQTITDNQAGKDQQVTTYRYDANGNHIGERNTDTVTHTDYENSVISYDALNRMDRVRDAAYVLTYGYDDNGNRIRIYTNYYQSASSASGTTQDYWYTYDAENRITLAEGQSSGNSIVQGTQGTLLSYDHAGNRTQAINIHGNATDEVDYTYTADNQLSTTTLHHTQNSNNKTGLSDQRFYDRAGREIEDDNYGLVDDINSTTVTRQLLSYNANGELLTQNSSTRQTNSNSWSNTSEIGYTSIAGETPAQLQADAGYYDGLGNASQYNVHIDNGNTSISYLSTFSPIGDSEQRTMERVNSAGLISGVTNYIYDAEGNNIEIDNPSNTGGVTQQNLIVDAQGHILQQNQTGANGPQTQNYYYANGNPIGSIGNIDANTFDYNYTPISSSYPPASPGSYIASGGESLYSVAQAEYGDSSLWYLIADANGLSGSTPLTAGEVLIIPNQVTNVHNTSDTFKPYNPNEILGSNTPQLTAPPPPKHSSNFVALAIIAVVAIVAAVVTAGAALAAEGAAIGSVSGLVTAGSTALAGGTVAGATIGGSAIAGGLLAAAAGGAAASAASQLTGNLFGVTHGFSFTDVALGALTAVATAGAGSVLGLGGTYNPATNVQSAGVDAGATFAQRASYGLAEGTLDSAAGQGLGILLHRQSDFSWSSLAAGAITNGVFRGINNFDVVNKFGNIGDGGLLKGTVEGFASGVAKNEIKAAFGGKGRIDFVSIAADSFGNAVGGSIIGVLETTPAEKQQGTANLSGFGSVSVAGDLGRFAQLPNVPDESGLAYNPSSSLGVPGIDASTPFTPNIPVVAPSGRTTLVSAGSALSTSQTASTVAANSDAANLNAAQAATGNGAPVGAVYGNDGGYIGPVAGVTVVGQKLGFFDRLTSQLEDGNFSGAFHTVAKEVSSDLSAVGDSIVHYADEAAHYAGEVVDGAAHAVVNTVTQPVLQAVDLAQVVGGLAYTGIAKSYNYINSELGLGGPTFVERIDPNFVSSLGQAEQNGNLGLGDRFHNLLGSVPILNLGVASYDLTTASLNGNYDNVAQQVGALAAGAAIGGLVESYGSYNVRLPVYADLQPGAIYSGLPIGVRAPLTAPEQGATISNRELLPSGIGGTEANYNKATGQGLYVLRDEEGVVRYVGRGDAPARLATHEDSIDKGDLTGEVLWTNNLTKAQAKGLEQGLIDNFGGAARQNPDTPLLNQYRSYAPENPNAGLYQNSVTDELWQATLRKLGL